MGEAAQELAVAAVPKELAATAAAGAGLAALDLLGLRLPEGVGAASD